MVISSCPLGRNPRGYDICSTLSRGADKLKKKNGEHKNKQAIGVIEKEALNFQSKIPK
jgi:hypothetical protein